MKATNFVADADPELLMRSIVNIYRRWLGDGRKPGSDALITSTRKHRPALVREIEEEWSRLAGCQYEDDQFPFDESYVVRKWTAFRKYDDASKREYYARVDELEREQFPLIAEAVQ